MEIINRFSTVHTTSKPGREIKYIVIHYTAGVTSRPGSAVNTADYYPKSQNVSADFTVDDAEIVQYNGNIKNRYCWHCGGNNYHTKGGSLFGKCTNANSIGVEICSTNSTGKMQNANDRTYSFTEAALNNTLELVRFLMTEYNIPAENVVRHYDVTGKPCPGIIGWNIESGSESKWAEFKKRISNGKVTVPQSAEKKPMFYIQVGAYSNEDNAKEFLKDVKKHYPQAFIKKGNLS